MTALLEAPRDDRRRISSSYLMTLLVAILLAVAPGLKLWTFATTPSSTAHWTDAPSVVLGGSAIEFLLASWLASGWQRRTACFAAAVFFLNVAFIAGSKWWSGELSCGCFGPLAVSPWLTTFLDLGILSILLWQLRGGKVEVSSASMARVLILFVLGIGSALAIPAIAYRFHPVAVSSEGVSDIGGLIVLEPEKWAGKQFPLIPYIAIRHPIEQGDCRVVLFHSDCTDCQRLLPQIEQVARTKALRTVLVEIPPVASPDQSIVPSGTVCEIGTLDPSKEWFVTTPVIIDLSDGRVIRQLSGAQARP